MSQPYPDIVSKFFPMAPESQFYNEWMLRTHFIETLHKALIDPDENNREAAKEFLDFSSLNYSDFDETFFEDGNWKIKKSGLKFRLYYLHKTMSALPLLRSKLMMLMG
jgi:hypothetical protein